MYSLYTKSIQKTFISVKPKPSLSFEDKILSYFHSLHKVRMSADVEGKRAIKKETGRAKEKILFYESSGGRAS